MRKRVFGVVALAAALAVVGIAAGAGSDPRVSAKLSGKAEVPKGSPSGSGTAVIELNTKTGKVCWVLRVRDVAKPLSAHVHKAPRGKSGPVVLPLGPRFAATGCTRAPKKVVKAVARNPGAYYVNVHTLKYLNGAIRGQLHAG
jgi:hypothetical protein